MNFSHHLDSNINMKNIQLTINRFCSITDQFHKTKKLYKKKVCYSINIINIIKLKSMNLNAINSLAARSTTFSTKSEL